MLSKLQTIVRKQGSIGSNYRYGWLAAIRNSSRQGKALRTNSLSSLSSPTLKYYHLPTNWMPRICFSQTTHTEQGTLIPFPLADIGEGITEVEILRWFVRNGDQVKQFDKLCEVQSDKATVEITSRYDGMVQDIQYKEGDIAKVGKPLCFIAKITDDKGVQSIGATETSKEETTEKKETLSFPKATDRRHAQVLATPAVRRIAREYGIDLSSIQGSGHHGRILKEDLLKHLEQRSMGENVQTTISSAVTPLEKDDHYIEPIRGLRRAMTKTMTLSLSIPQLTLGEEVIMDRLMNVRSSLKNAAKEQGVRLTYMPFFIKATSYSLSQYPILNSSVDQNCENIIFHRHHNISIAMDTPMGLTVPNIKHVEQKSVLEIAKELQLLMSLAEEGRLGEEHLKNGTFSLSNVGVISGTYASPVVFVPQVAIGAFGRTRQVPAIDQQGQVKATHTINVSWSADHRIIDGATMARFSKLWKSIIEEPEQMLLHLK
eukprot:jgi/Galph1/2193/GphlegSOOS_G906.1